MKNYQMLILIMVMLLIGFAGWTKVSNEIEANSQPCYTDSECQDYYGYILDVEEGDQE